MPQRGFTLLELIVTLAVLALILSTGLPQMNHLLARLNAHTFAHSLQEAIVTTRQRAILSNGRATLRAIDGWNSGWEMFEDRNHNGVREADEALVFHHSATPAQSFTVQANKPVQSYISYVGSGAGRFASGTARGGFQAGTLHICTQDNAVGYALTLARMGRLRLRRIGADDCRAGP